MKLGALMAMLAVFLLSTSPSYANSHHPQAFLKKIAGTVQEGQKIVEHYCASCHAEKPLIAIGAPKIGQISDWEWRMKPGMKILFKHTDEGLNAMPSRGGCFECSDQQLMLAIEAMLPKEFSKKSSKNPVK